MKKNDCSVKYKINNFFLLKFFSVFLLSVFCFLFFPTITRAATLYFNPSSGSYTVGDAFTVNVYVSSSDQAMNAASGVISFPQDKLEVTSLSKGGSIFSFWVQEPSFSNSVGVVNFEGVILNPGFTGSTGKVLTINLKVKTEGVAIFDFSSGSVLANDGKGTNILINSRDAHFSLGVPIITGSTTSTVTVGALSAPRIFSPTHPNPDVWYTNKDAKFTWNVPSGTTGVRLLIDRNPLSVPTITYAPAVSEKSVTGLEDGIWYFHVRLRNAKGWSVTAHFKIQIDTTPPQQIIIQFPHGVQSDDPRPVILFNTIDSLSGIAHYEVKIDSGDFAKIDPREIESNPYNLPTQSPGKKTVIVRAFDSAGNFTTATEEFEIVPIKSPRFVLCPDKINTDEIFIAEGETYPDATVVVSLKDERGIVMFHETKSNGIGQFKVIWPRPLARGTYEVFARVTDNRGAMSPKSSVFVLSVVSSAILHIGSIAITASIAVGLLVALVMIFIFIIWYAWHKFSLFKKRIQREACEAECVLHSAFVSLSEDIQKQVKLLEKARTKRQLTQEEEKIIKQLRRYLRDAEQVVKKEIEDIEKEVK